MLAGAIGSSEPHQSILQHSCRMRESTLIFFAFLANVKAHSGLLKCPIHGWLPEQNGVTGMLRQTVSLVCCPTNN